MRVCHQRTVLHAPCADHSFKLDDQLEADSTLMFQLCVNCNGHTFLCCVSAVTFSPWNGVFSSVSDAYPVPSGALSAPTWH
jgi:hypothetical protein